MIRLQVEIGGEPITRTVDRVRLVAPHVDEVQVKTTGTGYILADFLKKAGIQFTAVDPTR